MIYFTELENLPAYDAKGKYLGRLVDLIINPSKNALQVDGYVIRAPGKRMSSIARDQIMSISRDAIQTGVRGDAILSYTPDEGLILVREDVLDQQIIDVNHRKVVRVIDVDFDIRPDPTRTDLRIVAVNVGVPAAVRRLLQGILAKHLIRRIANFFSPRTIPWEFVNMIEPDPARRVKLHISYTRLAGLHPADLADILEELSPKEQRSVIESLDADVAAETVSEIQTRLQVALLDSLSTDRAADIIEEMDPDEAADVLQELPPERSAEVLANMGREEAEEVRELLSFEEKTAGGIMTTECVMVSSSADVEEAIEAVRKFEGSLEYLQALYLVESGDLLVGAVPLARLLVAGKDTPLRELALEPLISVPYHEDEKTVVNMFRKYNLLALPVVEDNGRLLGMVTADDVFELVVKDA